MIFRSLWILIVFYQTGCHGVIDPRKTILYGPGLNAHLPFPARYFFIQAVDENGNQINSTLDDVFTVQIDGIKDRCRIWTQVLNLHDGSFIVRYKLYETCFDLKIVVLYNNQNVAMSPYIIKGAIYQEECYCPEIDINVWLRDMDCPAKIDQIENDLSSFKNINMTDVLKEVRKRFVHPKSESVCHYSIVDNKVYRECIGEYVGFKMFTDAILLSLTRKVKLPNVEFIVNLGDWPLQKRTQSGTILPIFSWCKSDNVWDIVMPTYDITESTLETMGRVTLDMMSVQKNSGILWSNKTNRAIWRGRDSRQERLNLVILSRQHPELVDAALTNFFFFRDQMDVYGPTVPHMSFFDFFKYKYQINLDGTVASYRFPFLLAGGSAVFKQNSEYYEHFYKQLRPMYHFVPFKHDLSNLIDEVKWAMENDEEVHKIALQGRKFARENLMPKDIFCYYAILLKEFSQRLKIPSGNHKKMEIVAQPETPQSNCNCHRQKNTKVKDEL